ncbi:MAG: hypothetical protein JWL85_572, partial [Candidatus Saccharibacteria bacterium]|nr:hypothetical protein [Candidatus Saccharibacteria bacterium]
MKAVSARQVQIAAWIISIAAFALAAVAWAQMNQGYMGMQVLSPYQIFPLFGLL